MERKLLTLLVCALLVFTMLAGCTTSSAGVPTSALASANTATANPDPSASQPAAAKRNEVTINWGADFSGEPDADAMGQWFQEYFNIKIVPVAIDSEDKVKMLAASDTLPDLIGGGMEIGDSTFTQLRTGGLIRDFSDEALAKYPSLKKTLDEHPLLVSIKTSLKSNYWLPIYGNADMSLTAGTSPFYYRADWLEKLNLAVPTTVDEFYAMMKAFTEKDPDGNGQNDTYGMTGWLWQINFIPWVDMYAWVKGEDGKWIPGFISPAMLDALKFYNKLYQEKILDPEFANSSYKSMFYTDKVGVIGANGTPYHVWKNIIQGFGGTEHNGVQFSVDEAMAAVQFLPPLKVDAGSQPRWVQKMNSYGYALGSKASDDVVDRLLEIANWELSPEGRDFITYGFKDTDWIVKDGKAVSILPNNPTSGTQKNLWEVYPCLGGLQISMEYEVAGTPWLNPPLPQAVYDREKEWEALAAPFVVKSNLAIDNLSTPAKDKCTYGDAASGACEADFQNLITSQNIDADWNKLIDSYLNAQGLQAAIDEVNAAIAEQGLDK